MNELSAGALALIIFAGVLAALAAAGAIFGGILALKEKKNPGEGAKVNLAALRWACASTFVVATFSAAFGVAIQFKDQAFPLIFILLAAAFAASASIVTAALVKALKAPRG
ncbi:MAG: hypothetical protein J6U35_01255 [Clostridia bacterium]|nr:hypothetical protein [Clostridia bacterium]